MFNRIKQRWAEARGDAARNEVEEILLRYHRLETPQRSLVSSAFSRTLSDLEHRFGAALSEWSDERKKAVAKELNASSKNAFNARGDNLVAETNKLGAAYGRALLSLYLELQTLPGVYATIGVETINAWRTLELD